MNLADRNGPTYGLNDVCGSQTQLQRGTAARRAAA
jgi:hypothetical protein